MKKFWEWMGEKEYIPKHHHDNKYKENSSIMDAQFDWCEPTKQMLIGYMIEYLFTQFRKPMGFCLGGVLKEDGTMTKNINQIYKYLKDMIIAHNKLLKGKGN